MNNGVLSNCHKHTNKLSLKCPACQETSTACFMCIKENKNRGGKTYNALFCQPCKKKTYKCRECGYNDIKGFGFEWNGDKWVIKQCGSCYFKSRSTTTACSWMEA